MAEIERVRTGIPGFDDLIQGGIPKGFNMLITGTPGTGKTIFGLQYLYNGAMMGENGVYVSLETASDGLKEQARQFGWDFDKLEQEGKIKLVRIPLDVVKVDLFEVINAAVQSNNAKRLVFDSLDAFTINIDLFVIPVVYLGTKTRSVYTGNSEKRITYLVVDKLAELGTTNIVITASAQASEGRLTIDGVSEYACDGVVAVYNELIGARRTRTLNVLKMRNTSNSPYIHDFGFDKGGILVKPAEKVYE